MSIQTKGDAAICSSVGDIKKHEKFKKLSMTQRIEKLQEVYDKYGVKSNQFFTQVKPFIMWTTYRQLRGMPADMYLEDLINNAYEELIIAFEGGVTTYYNKLVNKQPIYGTPEYYAKYENIGKFVMDIVSSSVSKYRSKHFRKQVVHEDTSEDISERINFTDFEERYNLNYDLQEPVAIKFFNTFKFNEEFIKHLIIIKQTKPRNNILYNFMLWKEACFG